MAGTSAAKPDRPQAAPPNNGAPQMSEMPGPDGSSPNDGSGFDAPAISPFSIPDHELLRRIGRGAYGEVWLARSITGAFRAVKIVRRSSFDNHRPFEREFEGIRRFEPVSRTHDSQVDILHVGRGEDFFYYVMELADDQATGGQIPDPDLYKPRTLKSDLVFRSRLPIEECVSVAIALTTALEYLHGHGLVHRDVKPSNIVFVNGVAKLADIGLVTGVDTTRSYVGTEGFAAPEGPGTPQADLYSLGKVLYELATGKDRQEFPELPTQLREMPDRDGLMELNAVIAKACRHDPKDRYESAAAMRKDLELLKGGKSLARLHRLEGQLRFVRRASALVTLLAAVVGAGWVWQTRQTGIVRQLAHEKTQLADEKSKLAEENRARLVRLDIANGVRLMDADDYSGAMLWFAEALPLLTNSPAEEAIHRIRIQQVLNHTPRLMRVFSHDSSVISSAFSPDGKRVATGTLNGDLRIWDAESGKTVLGPVRFGRRITGLHYLKEGTRLLVHFRADQRAPGTSAMVDSETGRPVFPAVSNVVDYAFSSDARLLAVARTNSVVEVLDGSNGHVVVELKGHTNAITGLTFSSDGSLLASSSADKTVRLWRMPSGQPFGQPLRHSEAVERVVFSSDSRRLATAAGASSGSIWRSIHTWDMASGSEIGSPIPAKNYVFALDFIPGESRRLITADDDRGVTVRDADSHAAVLPTLKFAGSVARCWAFSPDGLHFAAGSDDGTARVWDFESGEPLTSRMRHVGWVESVSFSADGRHLLTTSDDGTAKIWDLGVLPEAAKPLQLGMEVVAGGITFQTPRALDPAGRHLVLSAVGGALLRVNLETFNLEGEPITGPSGKLTGTIVIDASGHQWAAANGLFVVDGLSRNAGLWREEGKQLRHFELEHPKPVRVLQFVKSGSELLTWCDDFRLRRWRTSDGKLLAEQEIRGDYVSMGKLSAGGDRATMIRKETFLPELLDLTKPGVSAVPLIGSRPLNMAAFSPDGKRVAGVGGDQHGHVWDALTGRELVRPFKHGGSLFWIEWSPDGRRVLTAGLGGEVKVWDAATGEPEAVPMGLSDKPMRLAHFSPDGRFVLARSDDHLVRVWDSMTAEPVTPLLKHSGEVRGVMLTKANRLVTVSDPAVVRAWDLAPNPLPADVLADWARFQAGITLDRFGAEHWLKPAELAELGQSLMARQPALFSSDAKHVAEWHWRQIPPMNTPAQVRSAEFHLKQLSGLDPSDSESKASWAKLEAARIPPRNPAAPPNLVDLSDFYTHSFGMLPWQDFSDLPTGIRILGGTQFDLRGLVQLEAADSEDLGSPGSFRLPMARGIRVDRRCRKLHFLQAAENGYRAKDGDVIARWVIHYADRSVREWPMIYGEHLRNWWHGVNDEPTPVSQATVAWEGHPPIPLQLQADSVRLFKATWTNPMPDVEVTSLDFIDGQGNVRPFVVAITAE
jgi:WD40 repeat protein